MNKGKIICAAVYLLFVSLPLGFLSLVSAVNSESCDAVEEIGRGLTGHLLGLGISSIAVTVILSVIVCIALFRAVRIFRSVLIFIVFLMVVFGTAWLAFGLSLLWINIECTIQGSGHIVYGLVLWCISALLMLDCCCNCEYKSGD